MWAPLPLAHMYVSIYPWLPDTIIAVQLTSGMYLPPSFHAAGVGASAEEVSYAQSRLQELKAAAARGPPAASATVPCEACARG